MAARGDPLLAMNSVSVSVTLGEIQWGLGLQPAAAGGRVVAEALGEWGWWWEGRVGLGCKMNGDEGLGEVHRRPTRHSLTAS